MNEHYIYDAILKRRSIRQYLDKPVERGKVELLLKAAMAAPSACNLQPWEFIVVDDAEALSALKDMTDQGKYNAPLAIVVCGIYKHIPWEGDSWQLDVGMAAQNIMLEATELGLASVCVGGFDEEGLQAALDIPDGVQIACIIEAGYPAYEREGRTWYDPAAVHYQKFDKDRHRVMRTLQMLSDDAAAGIL